MPNHTEAFCLMWYACKCGHRERIWNSRDGVTPFGCTCPSCGSIMDHVDWQRDLSVPNHKLIEGQRFWRDGTPPEAEAIMRRRIQKLIGTDHEVPPDIAGRLIESALSGSGESEFRNGWPMLDIYHSRSPERIISCLRNARNILADGGYEYVKEIDLLLQELGIISGKETCLKN